MSDEPVVRVTLQDIYKQGQETQARVGKLETKVDDLTRVTQRLDAHATRLDGVENRVTVLETRDQEQEKTKPPRMGPAGWISLAVSLVLAAITIIQVVAR